MLFRKTIFSLLVPLMLLGAGMRAMAQGDGACVGGKSTSPVKIEVFSDYQCPACQQFYLHTMRSVLSEYADAGKVCVIYREFPLSMHQHAREAAQYGDAAQRLGPRYWALVTDALYQSQDQWSRDGKIEPVVAAALTKEDMARLKKEMANPAVAAAIERDIALAKQRDVNQTPTFFVTGKGKTEKVAGSVQYPILKRYLDSLLGQ